MKLKRNLITLMVVSLLVTSLTACSGKQTDTTEETETTSDVVETTETTVVDEDVPHGSREDGNGHTGGHETVETTVETTVDNAPAYNPDEVDLNYVGVDIVRPIIPWNTQDAAIDYVMHACNDAGITDYTYLPAFWYPETDKPVAIPFTADAFTYIDDPYIADNPGYEDEFPFFSEDSICSNITFGTTSEMCLIVGTDANSLPTLSSIYASTDGSQTLDEVIASNENIIVPTLVDRQDTAHIDAELAQAIPGAQMARYNPYGYPNYNVVSEYDLFQGPGTYYIRMYIKSATGEWHATSETPTCIVVVDPVEAGLLTSYN